MAEPGDRLRDPTEFANARLQGGVQYVDKQYIDDDLGDLERGFFILRFLAPI
jgi:hypothetical protein